MCDLDTLKKGTEIELLYKGLKRPSATVISPLLPPTMCAEHYKQLYLNAQPPSPLDYRMSPFSPHKQEGG